MSGRSAFESQGAYRRPDQSQLSNFLDLPGDSAAGRSAERPATLPSGDGRQTYTTPGGSTITAGKGGGSYTTAGGKTIGAAGAGIKVEGAGGNTYARGVGGIGATDGVNSAFRAGAHWRARSQRLRRGECSRCGGRERKHPGRLGVGGSRSRRHYDRGRSWGSVYERPIRRGQHVVGREWQLPPLELLLARLV